MFGIIALRARIEHLEHQDALNEKFHNAVQKEAQANKEDHDNFNADILKIKESFKSCEVCMNKIITQHQQLEPIAALTSGHNAKLRKLSDEIEGFKTWIANLQKFNETLQKRLEFLEKDQPAKSIVKKKKKPAKPCRK